MLRRIGINVLYLVPGRVGGTEIYARRLVEALARAHPTVAFDVFCGRDAAASLGGEGWPDNVAVVPLPLPSAVKPARVLAELVLLPIWARRRGVELMHSLGTTTPMVGCGCRVVTVHDLIYDRFPETFPPAARTVLRALVPAGARRAHRVQVSSEATRSEVVEAFGLPRDGIDVVPLGIGMREVAEVEPEAVLRERFGLGERPVVLSVAAMLAHKNLPRLLAAVARVEQEPAPALVLVGHDGLARAELEAQARALGIADRVRFTGWVTDAELEGLYGLAAGFAYPSLHEGFGMPVLEAMRRGVPVACSNATSLPEVAGSAALLFDPTSEAAIAEALARLLAEPELREALGRRGRQQAAGFPWERTADAAWASYERALA